MASSLILSIERGKIGNRESVFGIISILKPLISKICKVKIKDVEIVEHILVYNFYPIDEFGNAVVVQGEDNESIYSQIDIEKMVGYMFLSDSSLARYIVEKEEIENVKYIHGIAVIPISHEYLFETPDPVERFEFTLQTYVKKGLFAFDFAPFDTDDFESVVQICKQFHIQILNRKDFTNWIMMTDVDFSISPEIWLRNALSLVRMGQFPFFTLSFKSIRDKTFNNDYDRKYGDVYEKYIIKYVALLAFADVSDKFPIARDFIYSLRVNSDYSISVQLSSYDLVKDFEQKFNDNFARLYTVITCKNIEDGVIKRYIIQTVDDDSYPVIFHGEGEEILIHRSPLAKLYPSPFNFDEKNMEEKKKELENKMKNFYKTCHDNIEPVNLEEIDKMDLKELLTLIPITENKITYCFSQDTIRKVEVNPLTRTPLSDDTVRKVDLGEYGLRGYFDVGVIYGLYSDSRQEKEEMNYEDIGLTQIVRIPVEKDYRELYGNLFLIKAIFKNGFESDIFEISLPTVGLEAIDELRSYVEVLWRKGFFISPWLKALKDESFSLITRNPILIKAKDSIFDGNKALNYLKLQI